MYIKTNSERVLFDGHLDETLKAEDGFSQRLRTYLSACPAEQLVAVWFGPTEIGQPHPAFRAAACDGDKRSDLRDSIEKRLKSKKKSTSQSSNSCGFLGDSPDRVKEFVESLDDLGLFKFAGREFPELLEKLPAPPVELLVPAARSEFIRTRAHLFSWVYGAGDSIARDLLYTRLPSREKRRLVRMLTHLVRRRYRWISPKLIHAMAFRPAAFEALDTRRETERAKPKSWGPLYRRATIPKSRGKRYLWIPNPPLRRLQKALLKIIGPSLSGAVPDYVFGCHAGRPGPMFHNAAAHTGNYLIANFDLKDFFPSTRLSHVISGLHYCMHKDIPMVDGDQLDQEAALRNAPTLSWKTDAQLLIAKLATHRGKLPQGSPLSPLLANLAFVPCDEKIRGRLQSRFGENQFTYTRYFDDITISISQGTAREGGIERPKDFLHVCRDDIKDALHHTGYRLQDRKSRASFLAEGHRVTGLLVNDKQVKLPRSKSKHVRSILHKINSQPFVVNAMQWQEQSDFVKPQFISLDQGHRWKCGSFARNCLSAERLAILMLRQQGVSLNVERVLVDWMPWFEHYTAEINQVSGKRSWRIVEWLLAASWQQQITVSCHDTENLNALSFSQGGETLCHIKSVGKPLDFFLLRQDHAIAVTRYWHHIKGVEGFLGAAPDQYPFSSIRDWHSKMQRSLKQISIDSRQDVEAPKSTATTRTADKKESDPAPPPAESKPETVSRRIAPLAQEIISHWEAHRKWFAANVLPRAEAYKKRFQSVANTHAEYDKWVDAAEKLFIGGLPKFGIYGGAKRLQSYKSNVLFDYFRIKSWENQRLVNRDDDGSAYLSVQKIEKTLKMDSTGETPLHMKQYVILESLSLYFNQSAKQSLEDAKAWKSGLRHNPWQAAPGDSIQTQFSKFEKVYSRLQSNSDEDKIFQASPNISMTAAMLKEKLQVNDDSQWIALQDFAQALYEDTMERIDPACWTEPLPKRPSELPKGNSEDDVKKRCLLQEMKNVFRYKARDGMNTKIVKVIVQLRNRKSHASEPSRRKEWRDIQKLVAAILGRDWQTEYGKEWDSYHAPDDLRLEPFEGLVVRYEILRRMVVMLERLATENRWKQVSVDARKKFSWKKYHGIRAAERGDDVDSAAGADGETSR